MPTVEARFRRELIKYWRRPAVMPRHSGLDGSLPRHGENARLGRAYQLGRGDAMTMTP
jgi:hypothetical protein